MNMPRIANLHLTLPVALYCIVYVLVFWRHHLSYGRLFMNGMRTMNYKRLLVFRVR